MSTGPKYPKRRFSARYTREMEAPDGCYLLPARGHLYVGDMSFSESKRPEKGGMDDPDEQKPEFEDYQQDEDSEYHYEDMSEAARLRFEIMDAKDRNGTGPDGHSY